MGVLPAHIAWIVPTETINQVSSLLELELQRLWVTMWALGTKPRSSRRAASAFNHWAEEKFCTCQSVSNHMTWRGLLEASFPLYSGALPTFSSGQSPVQWHGKEWQNPRSGSQTGHHVPTMSAVAPVGRLGCSRTFTCFLLRFLHRMPSRVLSSHSALGLLNSGTRLKCHPFQDVWEPMLHRKF